MKCHASAAISATAATPPTTSPDDTRVRATGCDAAAGDESARDFDGWMRVVRGVGAAALGASAADAVFDICVALVCIVASRCFSSAAACAAACLIVACASADEGSVASRLTMVASPAAGAVEAALVAAAAARIAAANSRAVW